MAGILDQIGSVATQAGGALADQLGDASDATQNAWQHMQAGEQNLNSPMAQGMVSAGMGLLNHSQNPDQDILPYLAYGAANLGSGINQENQQAKQAQQAMPSMLPRGFVRSMNGGF